MQFFLKLSRISCFLVGFTGLTTLVSSGHSPVPSLAATKHEPPPPFAPSTSNDQAMPTDAPGLDLTVDCTKKQKKAIKGAKDWGRKMLEAVQGFPKPDSDRESYGKLSAADLRRWEERSFGPNMDDNMRQSIRGELSDFHRLHAARRTLT